MATEEAERCLQCKAKPCVGGCPINVWIPEFIKLVAAGDFEWAYDKIKQPIIYQLYVVGFVLRKVSVKSFVSERDVEKQLALDGWSNLLPTRT